jgi:hypothetical protein
MTFYSNVESVAHTIYTCCEWVADLLGVTSLRYEVYMDDDFEYKLEVIHAI